MIYQPGEERRKDYTEEDSGKKRKVGEMEEVGVVEGLEGMSHLASVYSILYGS